MKDRLITKENMPMLAGILFALIGIMFGLTALDRYLESNSAKPTETQQTVTDVPIESQVISESQAEEIQSQAVSAIEAGEAVATLQNELIAATETADINSVFERLNPYFDAQQGAWSDISTASFTFNTTYDFNEGVIPVSWTGVDETGNEVAYVFANYNSSTGMFSNVEVLRTSYAYNLLNNDDVDYTMFPGMDPTGPSDSTEETGETTEPTEYQYPYEIGEVNPETGDVVTGYYYEGENDFRPIMTATLSDGTVIYYKMSNSGDYALCDEAGNLNSNYFYDPSTGEIY